MTVGGETTTTNETSQGAPRALQSGELRAKHSAACGGLAALWRAACVPADVNESNEEATHELMSMASEQWKQAGKADPKIKKTQM